MLRKYTANINHLADGNYLSDNFSLNIKSGYISLI